MQENKAVTANIQTGPRPAAGQLRIVIAGHVDHGKSTLIGRLLYDTGSLPDGKYDELKAICARRGTDTLEWSFLLDSFQAERDQAVTIDTTQIRFSTAAREYVIIDAPGHREFLKNMISGAAAADAAVLVVDAAEGLREQTRRHAYMLSLLGLRRIAVAVNKMDMAGFAAARFNEISREISSYLQSIGLVPQVIVPVSARDGDMIAARGARMGWYGGPTLLEALDRFESSSPASARPLRFPVQDVYRQGDTTRIIVGRVETGAMGKGDTLLFSPSGETARIASVETWPPDASKTQARAGDTAGITLDQPIFVERGHIASHEADPPKISNVFRASIFWLSHRPLQVGSAYKVRYGTLEAAVTVQSIDRVVDTETLAHDLQAKEVLRNAAAGVTFRSRNLLPLDAYEENERTGRLVIYEGHDIAGGGMIGMDGIPDQRRTARPKSANITAVSHLTTEEARAARNGHRGAVFWFTGLSGAGKSTLAMAVEQALFDRGLQTYVLDGDNVRRGLNSDLGFSPGDRAENIRRIGEVASLMARAGTVVITAFISPYRADRARARAAAPDRFHEIYISADLDTCERRDPKGLYRKARAGDIADFTGIGSPYEAPENADLVVDTQAADIERCVGQIVRYVLEHVKLQDTGRK